MSEALRVDPNITVISPSTPDANSQTLRECVQEAMRSYFQQLEGHPTGELYKMVMA